MYMYIYIYIYTYIYICIYMIRPGAYHYNIIMISTRSPSATVFGSSILNSSSILSTNLNNI